MTKVLRTDTLFFGLPLKIGDKIPKNNTDIGQEVEKYLTDPSSEVQSLQLYPNIRRLHVKLDTCLPSSASVERLFSLGGRVFTPLRSRLNSTHFEMMTFMLAYSSCN